MNNRIDLTDVILKQSTLISLYVVCYYSAFYVIGFVSEKCFTKFNNFSCFWKYPLIYFFLVFILFVILVFYVCDFLKEYVSENLKNEIYIMIFLLYFTVFTIVSFISVMGFGDEISLVAWLILPLFLFSSYFYSALKIIYFDLKKIDNKDIVATVLSITLFFALNIFGFIQANEQAKSNQKKHEQLVQKDLAI